MTIPVNAWVRLRPGYRFDAEKSGVFLGFTYLDSTAGLSAKAIEMSGPEPTPGEVSDCLDRPFMTFRLPGSAEVSPLDTEEIARLGLPPRPPWLRYFEPEGRPDPVWREDPALLGKFNQQFPDDIQAVFYFEGLTPELMWVRVDGVDTDVGGYEGVLLNTPHAAEAPTRRGWRLLERLGFRTEEATPRAEPFPLAGSRVTLRNAAGSEHPIYINEAMRENFREWDCRCEACGFDLHPGRVRDIVRRQFQNIRSDVSMMSFTTRCPMCVGTMIVRSRDMAQAGEQDLSDE